MTNEEWLAEHAEIITMDITDDEKMDAYVSKIDKSYLTFVGMEDKIDYIVTNGLTQVQNMNGVAGNSANIGFSEEEQLWYGWSHRAMYGFGIGSKVVKGDCAFSAPSLEDKIEEAIAFWSGDGHEDVTAKLDPDDPCNILVSWRYVDDPVEVPNDRLRGQISGSGYHFDPEDFGRGEWDAKTLEDARQMACDFAEGVS